VQSSAAVGETPIRNSAKLKIALCQIAVGADKPLNIKKVKDFLSSASEKGASLAVLPECWNSPYSTASFPQYAEPVPDVGALPDPTTSPSSYMLCNEARAKKLWLVAGSIPEREGTGTNEKLYNTCLVINSEGKIVGKHRKVHLFDINVPGRIAFKESDSLSAGNSVTVVQSPWGKIGVGICYDIRFPELAMLMREKGADMIIYPGAFNLVTGPAHWELLQRARAVDNQVNRCRDTILTIAL
jgi:omega-amidase